jgi:hypothetical protein
MTSVLYTEQAGSGHVFVREMKTNSYTGYSTIIMWTNLSKRRLMVLKTIWHHPRPGTFGAIGCWSRLEDLRHA